MNSHAFRNSFLQFPRNIIYQSMKILKSSEIHKLVAPNPTPNLFIPTHLQVYSSFEFPRYFRIQMGLEFPRVRVFSRIFEFPRVLVFPCNCEYLPCFFPPRRFEFPPIFLNSNFRALLYSREIANSYALFSPAVVNFYTTYG